MRRDDGRRATAAGDIRALPGVDALTEPVRSLVVRHDGVATASQLASAGFSADRVAHRVRSGEWQRLFRGVMVLQSGPTTWRQRARAALLTAGARSALSHRSAGYLHGFVPDPGAVIVVSVPAMQTVRAQAGLVVHRRRQMPFCGGGLRAVEPHASLVDLVERSTGIEAVVALTCDAIRSGLHPGRVLLEIERRSRLRHRQLLLEVLGGVVDDGVESPLEHRYLRDVERGHGLPASTGQLRQLVDGRWIRADRVYEGLGVRIELDGQLAHPFGRTDRDVWRDNAVMLEHAELTLRYRWLHVATQACATAGQVAAALRTRGWLGLAHPCAPTCPLPARP